MKTCIFCDKRINKTYYTCKEHLSWYKEYKDTIWFKELIRMQAKQYSISYREEGINYIDSVPNIHINETNYYKENRGRKARLNHSKIIQLRRYYTYKQLSVIFECSIVSIKDIIARKAGYLVKKNKKYSNSL